MTAFADTIVFMTVIMMAVSVTVMTSLPEEEGSISPDEFLGMVSSIEIRLSDMTDLEDENLIPLSDAMAYAMEHESSVNGYLESLLDCIYGPGRYCLEYSFGESSSTVGERKDFFKSYASRDYAVTVGGYVRAELEFYA